MKKILKTLVLMAAMMTIATTSLGATMTKPLETAMAPLNKELVAKVVAFVRPIPTVPEVLEALPSFFEKEDLQFAPEYQHLVLDFLAERYKLPSGNRDIMSPAQRIALMRANYLAQKEFSADVQTEIRRSAEIRQVKEEVAALRNSFLETDQTSREEMAEIVGNQAAILALLADHEVKIDSLSAGLASVRAAVQNGFNLQAAMLPVLERARLGKEPNPEVTQALRRQQ